MCILPMGYFVSFLYRFSSSFFFILHCHVWRIYENVYIFNLRTEDNFIAHNSYLFHSSEYANSLISSFVIFSIHCFLFIRLWLLRIGKKILFPWVWVCVNNGTESEWANFNAYDSFSSKAKEEKKIKWVFKYNKIVLQLFIEDKIKETKNRVMWIKETASQPAKFSVVDSHNR